jgi:asparagine synthase (glutamine-hydrolysing)
MLTGQMGNLTLHAGGLPVLAEWLHSGRWNQWWREARSAAAKGNGRWRGILYNSFAPWMPAPLEKLLWQTVERDSAREAQNFLRIRRLTHQSAGQTLGGDLFADRLAMIRLNDTGVFRLGVLAESGIDERDPTADRRLIEFSLSLPPDQLLGDGVSRPLARRALAPYLPAEIINAPLRGYQAADWLERLDKPEALALIEEISTSHAAQQLLDFDRMKAAVESWPGADPASLASRTIYRRRFTLALAIGVFLQEYEQELLYSGDRASVC